ncbi:MAG: hypothetical protein MUC91_06335 [Verrucomicrobia bacterium]|nr:hypothetical protein [Verrucomicrobiota bacterium]
MILPVLLALDTGICILTQYLAGRRLRNAWSALVVSACGVLCLGAALSLMFPMSSPTPGWRLSNTSKTTGPVWEQNSYVRQALGMRTDLKLQEAGYRWNAWSRTLVSDDLSQARYEFDAMTRREGGTIRETLTNAAVTFHYLGEGRWFVLGSGQLSEVRFEVSTLDEMSRGPLPVPPPPSSKPFDDLGLPYPRLNFVAGSNGPAQTFPNPLAVVEAWQQTAEYEAWQKLGNMRSFAFTNALGYRFGIQAWGIGQRDNQAVPLLGGTSLWRPDSTLMASAPGANGAYRRWEVSVLDDSGTNVTCKLSVQREASDRPFQITKVNRSPGAVPAQMSFGPVIERVVNGEGNARAPFIARLPVGSVELVALSHYPSTNEPWWRPDGTPAGKGLFMTEASGNSTDAFRMFALVVRLLDMPTNASAPTWKLEPRNTWAEGKAFPVGGGAGGKLAMISAKQPRSATTANVRIGIASGAWETIAKAQARAIPPLPQPSAHGEVAFLTPSAKDDSLRLTATHTIKDMELRLVAVEADGTEHVGSDVDQMLSDTMGNTTVTFAGLSLNGAIQRHVEFRFQVRPYRWVEFRNVSLEPGRTTRVEVIPASAGAKPEAKSATLQFRWIAPDRSTAPVDELPDPNDRSGQTRLRLLREVFLDDAAVATATVGTNELGNAEITLHLTDEGSRMLARVTDRKNGRRFAIVHQGRILSAPTVKGMVVGRELKIVGNFSEAETGQLLNALNKSPASEASTPTVKIQVGFKDGRYTVTNAGAGVVTVTTEGKEGQLQIGPNGTGYFDSDARFRIGDIQIVGGRRLEVLNAGTNMIQIAHPGSDGVEEILKLGEMGTGYFDKKTTVTVSSPGVITPPSSQIPTQNHQVTLTNGVSLEVLAVGRNPRGATEWWKPDGTRLAQAPVEIVDLPELAPTRRSEITIRPENEYLVYVRRESPSGMAVESSSSTFMPFPTEWESTATVRERNSKQRASALLVYYAEPPDTVIYREAVACGPWEAVSVYDVNTKETRDLGRGVMALWSEPRYEQGALRFDVMHNANRERYALRMVARRRNGGDEMLGFHTGVISGSPAKGFALIHGTEAEAKARLQQVKELVLERTPWVRGEISGIAFRPAPPRADQASAGNATAQQTTSLGFGPVIERLVPLAFPGTTNWFLDLETGTMLMPPPEFADAVTGRNDLLSWDNLTVTRKEQFAEWAKATGADLFVYAQETLETIGGIWVLAHGPTPESWDDLDALTLAQSEAVIARMERSQKDSERMERFGLGPRRMLHPSQSVNYFFKTRDGTLGVLQLAGTSDNPRGVKLRYKLVLNANSATTPTNPAAQPLASNPSRVARDAPSLPGAQPAFARPLPPATSRELAARYEAAKVISSVTQRDAALAKLAREAAVAGEVALTKKALADIISFNFRDGAATHAARALARRGMRTEALEVARTISSFTNRDAVLGELAQ